MLLSCSCLLLPSDAEAGTWCNASVIPRRSYWPPSWVRSRCGNALWELTLGTWELLCFFCGFTMFYWVFGCELLVILLALTMWPLDGESKWSLNLALFGYFWCLSKRPAGGWIIADWILVDYCRQILVNRFSLWEVWFLGGRATPPANVCSNGAFDQMKSRPGFGISFQTNRRRPPAYGAWNSRRLPVEERGKEKWKPIWNCLVFHFLCFNSHLEKTITNYKSLRI